MPGYDLRCWNQLKYQTKGMTKFALFALLEVSDDISSSNVFFFMTKIKIDITTPYCIFSFG